MIANRNNDRNNAGFTLIELLVVIATLALLAAMILPAIAGTRPNNQAAQCLNNLRRLAAAWSMFPADNSDSIMPNSGWVGGFMDWTSSQFNTNTAILLDPQDSPIANYVKSAALFKCPVDKYQSAIQSGPRVRSLSLNGVLAGLGGGSGPIVKGSAPFGSGRKYYGAGSLGAGGPVRKISELNKPGPAQTFLILDEHPDSINDSTYMFDVGYNLGTEHWRDLPASYHNGGVGISYADGRAEIHQWQERTDPIKKTIYPVTMSVGKAWTVPAMNSKDYKWVQDHMPYREQ